MELEEDDEPPAFHLIAEIQGEPESLPVSVFLEAASEQLVSIGVNWRGVTADDESAARESRWALGVSAPFGERPLRDFHALTRLLHAIVPEPVLVVDMDSLVPRPGTWLAEVACAETPPSPAHLFSIHQVSEPGSAVAWLHTHGLSRCGSIDLEILDAPAAEAGLLAQMINAAAGLFIERGVPEPSDRFAVGKDLDLVWLPWDEALERESLQAPGGPSDRDEVHVGARGVLYAPESDGRTVNPSTYLPVLLANPLLYVSTMETERMALLASERLPRFLALYRSQAGQPGWMFLVKLGYPVDDDRRRSASTSGFRSTASTAATSTQRCSIRPTASRGCSKANARSTPWTY